MSTAAEEALRGLVVPPKDRSRPQDLSAEQLNDLLSSDSLESH